MQTWITISLEDERQFVVLIKSIGEREKWSDYDTRLGLSASFYYFGTDKNNDVLRLLDGAAAAGGTAGLLLVVRYNPGLFLFFLLQRVLFALAFPAAQAFGGKSFVAEGRPRPKVLAAFAPFDF